MLNAAEEIETSKYKNEILDSRNALLERSTSFGERELRMTNLYPSKLFKHPLNLLLKVFVDNKIF
jgi:hypothetical protein